MIAAALYAGLRPEEQARLQGHLAGCLACRREVDDLKRTVQALGPVTVESSDVQRDVFIAGIRKKLGQKIHRKLAIRKPVVRGPAWILPTAAAAALFLAAAAIFIATRGTPPEPVVQAPAPKPVPPPEPKPAPPLEPAPPAPAPAPRPDVVPAPAPAPVPPAPPPPPAPVPAPPEKPAVAEAPAPAPASRETVAVMAHFDAITGDVAVLTEAGRVPAKADLGLIPGQELHTASRSSSAVIKITDGTRITLAADTVLRLTSDLKAGAGRGFLLTRGSLRAEVSKQPAGAPMIFATPTAEARVLGTELLLTAGGDATRLEVRTGKVRLTRKEDGASVDVASGQVATAAKTGALAARPARVAQGLQALYLFHEGQGGVIHDVAALGAPLDLRIPKPRSAPWASPGLRVEGNVRIDTDGAATRLIEACRKSQELTLEAWIQPARAALDFEGAILALSTDVQDRNFALVQGTAGSFDATLRTSTTDGGGRPPLSSGKGTCEAKLTHVVFTRTAAGQERLYVNGVERASRVRAGTFATWNDGFHLYVGNESFEERPWAGTYRLVAIYSQALSPAEVVRNFKGGAE
jgi:hypothetical protein